RASSNPTLKNIDNSEYLCYNCRERVVTHRSIEEESSMELGAFSISLAVKDIEASRKFYEAFGFQVFGGNAAQNWLILKNGDHVIGLFQGMFEKNLLTF